MFTTEEAYIERCYEIINESFDVEIEEYQELKPVIASYTEESFAAFTVSDFKKIVQLYCSSEELEQYDEFTDDVYEKLANEKQSVLNGKIFWGYIDICRSECNTLDGDSDGED